MRTHVIEQVRSLDLFRGMASNNFSEMVADAELRDVPELGIVATEGERPTHLNLIIEGTLEIFASHNHRETSLGVAGPVIIFFMTSIIGDLPCLASARAIKPSQVFQIPLRAVATAIERDPALAVAVVERLSHYCRNMTMELKSQRLRTSIERLANWILHHEDQNGRRGGFTLPYDKRTLAARLGMTPENLSRNFALLAEHGVTIQRRDVAVADWTKLATFAKPTSSIDGDDYYPADVEAPDKTAV